MTKIVGIHGIGQQYSGSSELTQKWWLALQDGLKAARQDATADNLKLDDVRVSFFGELFRPGSGAMAGRAPAYTADDIEAGLERELVKKFYDAAVQQDPSLGPPEGSMGRASVTVQVMVERLLHSPTFAAAAEHVLVGDLKQVSEYLEDKTERAKVLQRVDKALSSDTEVLIGHSLGSVIAYKYLCEFQPESVKLLVTLGSPLGIHNLIFHRLTPPPVEGKGQWPGAVTWVNVADLNDKVALCKELADLFPGPQSSVVDDRLVDNGNKPHDIVRYLNSTQTGSALYDALR